MKRTLLLLALIAVAPLTLAQTVRNCVTLSCTVESTTFPPAPAIQPTQCRLFDGGVLVVTTPVTGTPPFCSFVRNFTAGSHTLTAKAVAADGSESGFSNSVVFTSSAGAPPVPGNLRLVP